jgi:hypothetical protein
MPYNTTHPLTDVLIQVFNPTAGSQTGSRITATSHVSGKLIAAGFVPNSLVASAMTMAVLVGDNTSNLASSFATVITSTIGSFSSTLLNEGGCMSANPTTTIFVKEGDAIQWVTSGGNTSAIGATVFAVLRKGQG